AADADGSIAKVEFYNGTTLLGSDVTSPYTFTWSNIAAGNYVFTAKATDNGGLVTSSVVVAVSVINENVAPTVSITSPSADASFIAPASITINATAADADGSIAKVEFYNGTTLLGTDEVSPYTFTWSDVAAGSYTLIARTTDNGGLVTSSGAVAVSVINENVAPTVSITSPSADASFIAPASITINAAAADADGSITKVDFYNGTTLLSTDDTSPYTFTWSNVAAGSYTLTAKATDNGGLVTSSDTVAIYVINPNVAPTVSITSPLPTATLVSPTSITIEAIAADVDGSIAKVDFYNGSTLLGTDVTSPYTFTWDNVHSGSYTLTAIATDSEGLTTISDKVIVSVTKKNRPPSVKIVNPSSSTVTGLSASSFVSNATFTAPALINISAEALDSDGVVSKVEFYNGTQLLSIVETAPYTWDWQNVPAGNYTLTAIATDDAGLTTISDSIFISVAANKAPVVYITSPVINQVFNEVSTIGINAVATDIDGSISKVEFYNGNTLIGTDYTSPYSIDWGNLPSGYYGITAKATDNGGKVTSSSAITFSVITSKVPPAVKIAYPLANRIYHVPANINITAEATDADGTIAKVEFYNGTVLVKTEYIYPYTCTLQNLPVGNYILTAKAYDNDGLVTTSASVPVAITINSAPDVTLTSPVINSDYAAPASIKLSAEASDSDGKITKVEFYSGTTLLIIKKYFPYTWYWNNVPAGNYTIIAKAYDNEGLVTTTTRTFVTVHENVAPIVSIINPTILNSNYSEAASINLSAEASDSDGTISKIEFYNGTTLLATKRYLPYSWNWENVAAGSYTIVAKAYDNAGASSTSSPVEIVVSSNGLTGARPANNNLVANISKNHLEDVSVKVGPNPTRDVLSVLAKGIEKNKGLKISILSMSGNLLKTSDFVGKNEVLQINVSSLRAGMYLMKLVSEGTVVYKQFEKQ
ncbi:MAG: Ig-like domain-containing protein, partial [Ginsengibacter sp.]